MGNTDGHGETMFEEITHRTADKGFLEKAPFAIGKGETDPEDED
jgi:hypothetical protein